MSYTLACELSDRITAAASLAGNMYNSQPGECCPGRPVPLMEIHSTADTIMPYGGGIVGESMDNILAFWVGFNNFSPAQIVTDVPDSVPGDDSTDQHQVYTGCGRDVDIEHFKILKGGHS